MKKLPLILLLTSLFPFAVHAECNPVTFEGCFCSPSTPEGCKVEEPEMPLFNSHLDAEGNYFHMLEGLAIMTLEIQKRIPDFQGFPLSIFLDRQYQDCREAKGQIYSQSDELPYMGVCFIFKDQRDAESNYKFGVTTYYQYWDLLQKLITPIEKPCDSLGWKNGNVWKAKSDVANNGVVVMERRYCDGKGKALISNFRVEDALGAEVVSTRFKQCDSHNQGRLHQIINKTGASLGPNPVFVRYDFNGKEECRRVENPARDYR